MDFYSKRNGMSPQVGAGEGVGSQKKKKKVLRQQQTEEQSSKDADLARLELSAWTSCACFASFNLATQPDRWDFWTSRSSMLKSPSLDCFQSVLVLRNQSAFFKLWEKQGAASEEREEEEKEEDEGATVCKK